LGAAFFYVFLERELSIGRDSSRWVSMEYRTVSD